MSEKLETKISPFDFAKSATHTKEYLMEDEESEKSYVPFLINKTLSFNVETLMYANEMNLCSNLDKKLQYDYYFHILPKKKYYNKWFKKKDNDTLVMLMDYYNCSIQKAREAMNLLSDEQIKTIRKKIEQGGIDK